MTVGPPERRNAGHPRRPLGQLGMAVSSRTTEYAFPMFCPLIAAPRVATFSGPPMVGRAGDHDVRLGIVGEVGRDAGLGGGHDGCLRGARRVPNGRAASW